MDYNIKVKYDSAGGKGAGAFATRRKVIDAQRAAGQKPTGSASPTMNRELVNSIQKLIASNKELSQSIRANRGGGGPGGGSPRGATGFNNGGFGGIGSSLPIVGALVAAVGYAITKINQIGNAYIELASRQVGTAGVGGFQRGRRGMYLQTDLGAMEKSHRMSAGRFGGAGREVSDRMIGVGTVFGMGAGEVGQLSGTFARGRGNLGRAVETAAGGGIETELPLFMQSMASILEEAVTNGVNSSSLADDLGDQIVSLTRASQTNSVGMAANIIRNRRGTQQQVAQGQVGGYEQFVAYRAAGTAINRRLADPAQREEYLGQMMNQGVLSLDEVNAARARASSEGRGITMADLEAQGTNIGPTLRRFYSARGETDQRNDALAFHKRTFGDTPEGMRRYMAMNTSGLNPNETAAEWTAQQIPQGTQTAGAGILDAKYTAQTRNRSMGAVRREGGRQELLMTHGRAFADLSMVMEKSLIKMTNALMPSAESLDKFVTQIERLADTTPGVFSKAWQSIKDSMSASGPGSYDGMM